MKEKDVLEYAETNLNELISYRNHKNLDTYKKYRSIKL